MPMGFDQPDNALRLQRLGVGTYLEPRKFKGNRVARTLGRLLDVPSVAAACTEYQDKMLAQNGLSLTCDVLERL